MILVPIGLSGIIMVNSEIDHLLNIDYNTEDISCDIQCSPCAPTSVNIALILFISLTSLSLAT